MAGSFESVLCLLSNDKWFALLFAAIDNVYQNQVGTALVSLLLASSIPLIVCPSCQQFKFEWINYLGLFA